MTFLLGISISEASSIRDLLKDIHEGYEELVYGDEIEAAIDILEDIINNNLEVTTKMNDETQTTDAKYTEEQLQAFAKEFVAKCDNGNPTEEAQNYALDFFKGDAEDMVRADAYVQELLKASNDDAPEAPSAA
jgi:hypothetical protein